MDISIISKKLNEKKYKSVQEFKDEVLLIWKNCMLYNQHGSQIYIIAEELEEISQALFKKFELTSINNSGK